MKLRHLTDNTCASCGARCVEETQTSRHCNGQWFESQGFECGARIRWVPNFSRQEQVMVCPKSQTRILLERDTLLVRNELLATLMSVKACDVVIQMFEKAIEGIRV